ncbi:MAG: hypothetical protein KIT10_03615 [Flavobacteriales bacterium]|nr:hypothetical protein [Flavobacteriales bacterium]
MMRTANISRILLAGTLLLALGCKKKDDATPPAPPTGGGGGGGSSCEAQWLPVVMCHGALASGDTWAGQAKRMVQNGYCTDRIFVHDRNTVGGSGHVALLDAFIDQVLAQTGAAQVELVGHSAGGGLGYDYLADAGRAAKVAHYVHIGSSAAAGPAGPGGNVPTLNIWSPDDAIASGGNINGAVNVQLPGQDHYQVATSAEAFAAMFAFFRGQAPATTDLVADGARTVAGRAVTFGENEPISGAPVLVFKTDPATGMRLSNEPAHSFTTSTTGHWGPFSAEANTWYEFEITPPGGRRIHYYREPFIASDRLVYLRTMPPPTSLAGILLSSLPTDDAQGVLTVFTASQAVEAGRDDLTANGTYLATPTFAPASNCTIAWFLYDANNNGQSEGTAAGLFGSFPFLSGVDLFFVPGGAAEVTLNGRTMRARNWPSASEGITVLVFD